MTDSVTYSLGYKRALPNYENTTAFFSITREVPEGIDIESVKEQMVETVERWLVDKITEIDADAGR